jgi:formate hydrogenlyase transcriptional activator
LSPGKELRVPLTELRSVQATPVADEVALISSSTPLATLEEAERQHILRALRQTEWRVAGPRGAAKMLGMKRTTLQARIRKLAIRRPI